VNIKKHTIISSVYNFSHEPRRAQQS